ncbi:MAG: hypothetical protein ACXV8Q_00705 [Methylobacter sp.]
MNEHPILFGAPMVNAILDGRKTQTRRIMKQQPVFIPNKGFEVVDKGGNKIVYPSKQSICHFRSTYGQQGDRLWVRETYMPDAPMDGTWADVEFYGCKNAPLSLIPTRYQKPEHCLFRATWNGEDLTGWKPSIHMPRWASRIDLEITGIRVERLQDISEADAIAEGITGPHDVGYQAYKVPDDSKPRYSNAISAYESLWESINGRESWEANPWVWVIEFKKLDRYCIIYVKRKKQSAPRKCLNTLSAPNVL